MCIRDRCIIEVRKNLYSVLRPEECTRSTLYCDQWCTIEVRKNLYSVLRLEEYTRSTLYRDQWCTIEVRKICTAFCDRRNVLAVHCTETSGVPSRYEKNLYRVLRPEERTRSTLYRDQWCTIELRKICTAFFDRRNILVVRYIAASGVPVRYEKIC